jgi:3-methyladenine DNA glycosylase Mpg
MNNLNFLEEGAVESAQKLLGWRLYKQEADSLVGGVIVETEAYTQQDAASTATAAELPAQR